MGQLEIKFNHAMKQLHSIILLVCFAFAAGNAKAQFVTSDSWTATDALGRKISDYKAAGERKRDKFVAMFYWTWHQGVDDTTFQVGNITEIVR